jgi:serine O-acetyltransferase
VIGETAVIGNNVSMLHKVTLGGSGKKQVQRHPIVGDGTRHMDTSLARLISVYSGVLLGAGATLLGEYCHHV